MPQFQMRLGYEHPDQGDDPQQDETANASIAIAKWTGEFLNRWYAGHAWHVEVDIGRKKRGGLIKIRLNGIMPAGYWYNVQLATAISDPAGKCIREAGGNLLERYKLPRNNFDLDHWRCALNDMPAFARMTGRGHLAPLLT